MGFDKEQDMKENLKRKLCYVCRKMSFLRCTHCNRVYCGSECQMKDWKNHQSGLGSLNPKAEKKFLDTPSVSKLSVQDRIKKAQFGKSPYVDD
ncbi:unnamed protein product [Chironomus riparius]|uniref:MYND-type domain-containing protein n=1 Tax=Chironomus riparius TaxID=315576 RepID=A0A9N9WJC5_9DIPT|nr:unnamed protein product [Chironomus riparius]